jgi:hypothetical protein
MPSVDDFSRAQATPDAQPPTPHPDPVDVARLARAAALRAWMAAAWRMLAGNARAEDPVHWARETKSKNREDLPMRRRHYEAYVVPHQID